ncbi:Synaptogyrin-2 [Trichoplax sp. H2]|nr:Synaptogyrin-2 [Trichoplax sp. H2]|eukprot:RDD42088.1 Synaptogyrin-2 [Trichoplax sp. H2]
MIVFAIMASRIDRHYCPMNDYQACNVGLAFGVITFLIAMIFIYYDFNIDGKQDANIKRKFVICDFLISLLLSLLWFAIFLYLAIVNRPYYPDTSAAVAFSFFSILSWSLQTYLAYQSSSQADFHYYSEMIFDRNSKHDYSPVAVQIGNSSTKQEPFTGTHDNYLSSHSSSY